MIDQSRTSPQPTAHTNPKTQRWYQQGGHLSHCNKGMAIALGRSELRCWAKAQLPDGSVNRGACMAICPSLAPMGDTPNHYHPIHVQASSGSIPSTTPTSPTSAPVRTRSVAHLLFCRHPSHKSIPSLFPLPPNTISRLRLLHKGGRAALARGPQGLGSLRQQHGR